MNKNNFVPVVAVIAILGFIFSGIALFRAPSVVNNTQPPVGAVPGNEFQNQLVIRGGMLSGKLLATTSNATAITLTANEFAGWANSSIVSYTPINTAARTITLPASSTLAGVLQTAGDTQEFCFRNATTTSAIAITFAGGTGTNLLVASTTLTTTSGPKIVMSGKIACFTAIRQPASATAFDIDVIMQVFQ